MDTLRLLLLGGLFLRDSFRDLGHTVVTAGPDQRADVPIFHPVLLSRLLERLAGQGFTPDAALFTDNGNLPQFIGLEDLDCPSLFYSIDTFCNPWHLPYAHAFDGVYAAQKGHAELFAAQGHEARWLPLFCPRALDDAEAPWAERDIPAAFVGTLRPRNIPSRLPFLKRFRALHPLFIKEGAYLPVFARSRIVLNQTACSELNFRCFEAAGCGAALLMEQCAELEELFTPGVNILPPYPRNDAAAAAAIARAWLADPEKLRRTAKAGRDLIAARHTAAHRARSIGRRLAVLARNGAHRRRLAERTTRRRLLATAFAVIGAELDQAQFAAHRDFYLKLHETCC